MSERPTDDQLQQAFDGVLDPAEGKALFAELEASEDGRRRVEALGALRAQLRDHSAQESALTRAESDALFDRIVNAVDAGPTQDVDAAPANLRLVPGGSEEETPARESLRPNRPDLRRILVPATAFVAAAAGFLLIWNASSGGLPSGPRGLPELVTVEEAAHGSEVVEVDFGPNIGTIFEVEGNAGEPVAVVWISDGFGSDEEPEEVIQ